MTKHNKTLYPLAEVSPYLQLEKDANEAFLAVYNASLKAQVDELLCYGMPYLLQNRQTLQEILIQTGLALPTNEIDLARLQYLMKAWTGENHKRGVDFLRLVLQCLYPNAFDVYQLWQPKNKTYPLEGVREEEAKAKGIENYFLTSRLKVEVASVADDSGKYLPAYKAALQRIIAARFVIDISLSRSFDGAGLAIGAVAECFSHIAHFAGAMVKLEKYGPDYPELPDEIEIVITKETE